MPPKQRNCASPPPPACRASPPYSPPSWTPIFGWLLCEKSLIGSRLRPRPCPSLIFLPFYLVTPNNGTTLLHTIQPGCTSSPTSPLSWLPTFDCYVLPLNGHHLRPRPCLPLYFLMGLALVPQTGEPTVAPSNMMAHTLRKPIPIGSGGAMSWWCSLPTHRERGLKPVEGRAAWLMLVVVSWCCQKNSLGALNVL